MTLAIHNKSRKSLRVVLPPRPDRSGATGQFGGMGGMGGGGMGGMGGGMGGAAWVAAVWVVVVWAAVWAVVVWAAGMGGGMVRRTMPPTMGMMMLSRLIMYLCGDYDSWDHASLMIGMMGGDGRWHGWHGRWHGWYGRWHGWYGRRNAFRSADQLSLAPTSSRSEPRSAYSSRRPLATPIPTSETGV